MPSRSRSVSRGRRSKRARSMSVGSGMYSRAVVSRSVSRRRRTKRTIRVQSAHTFSRRKLMDTITVNDVILSDNLVYTFDQIVGYSEFSALFENYQITKISVTFQLINNPDARFTAGSAIDQVANWYPKIWYTVDHDGGADETLATMKERQGIKCRILKPDEFIKVSFTPMCRTLTYKTATTEGFAPRNIKLDMADTNVPHYGLLYLIDTNGINPNDTYPFKIAMETKFNFTCSGVR